MIHLRSVDRPRILCYANPDFKYHRPYSKSAKLLSSHQAKQSRFFRLYSQRIQTQFRIRLLKRRCPFRSFHYWFGTLCSEARDAPFAKFEQSKISYQGPLKMSHCVTSNTFLDTLISKYWPETFTNRKLCFRRTNYIPKLFSTAFLEVDLLTIKSRDIYVTLAAPKGLRFS